MALQSNMSATSKDERMSLSAGICAIQPSPTSCCLPKNVPKWFGKMGGLTFSSKLWPSFCSAHS
eukprot:3167255-Alexandrium_andersonii.AAC.1